MKDRWEDFARQFKSFSQLGKEILGQPFPIFLDQLRKNPNTVKMGWG